MEKIEPGKFVSFGYDLYAVEDGKETLVHQMDREDPEKIVLGVTRYVIEPLERALTGLKAGDKFEVDATSEESFGPVDPEKVVQLEREIFMVDGKFDEKMIRPGAAVPMMTTDGFKVYGVVVGVGPQTVTMDFNHPLAGKAVRFKGEIFEVRDATEEELKPAHCCCDDCGCDDECGDCGCDDHHHHCGDDACHCHD